MRVTIADDSLLIREGLARLLAETGIQVVDTVPDAEQLWKCVTLAEPDVVVLDIKMPPTYTAEGLVAAQELRHRHPDVGVLVLSQYLAASYATRLLDEVPERAGYLLKDRVSDVAVLTDALRRIDEGECVVDPTIVARLVRKQSEAGPLDGLTARERDVLAFMAQGRSNRGIGHELCLTEKTVEAHVRHVFLKLGLETSPDDHRRVLAVLTHLRAGPT